MPYRCAVPFAAVDCPVHGTVDIDEHEYMRQMARPDSLWCCPICRSAAQFNDERYEELNPEPEE